MWPSFFVMMWNRVSKSRSLLTSERTVIALGPCSFAASSERFLVATGNRHLRACLLEQLGGSQPYSAAAARDHCNFFFESPHSPFLPRPIQLACLCGSGSRQLATKKIANGSRNFLDMRLQREVPRVVKMHFGGWVVTF